MTEDIINKLLSGNISPDIAVVAMLIYFVSRLIIQHKEVMKWRELLKEELKEVNALLSSMRDILNKKG